MKTYNWFLGIVLITFFMIGYVLRILIESQNRFLIFTFIGVIILIICVYIYIEIKSRTKTENNAPQEIQFTVHNKQCPFCGGEVKRKEVSEKDINCGRSGSHVYTTYRMVCKECAAESTPYTYDWWSN